MKQCATIKWKICLARWRIRSEINDDICKNTEKKPLVQSEDTVRHSTLNNYYLLSLKKISNHITLCRIGKL